MRTFTCVFSAVLFRIPNRPQNKCQTNGKWQEKSYRYSEWWPLMFQDEEDPISADSAGLYKNRVINRSITSERDSVHIRRQMSNMCADREWERERPREREKFICNMVSVPGQNLGAVGFSVCLSLHILLLFTFFTDSGWECESEWLFVSICHPARSWWLPLLPKGSSPSGFWMPLQSKYWMNSNLDCFCTSNAKAIPKSSTDIFPSGL